MKKARFKKTLAAITVLLILALSMIGTNALLANADAGGTGKYLIVKFAGAPEPAAGFTVTATKTASGQTWLYSYSGQQWKLGAGDVLLQAFYPASYRFVTWILKDTKGVTTVTEENPAVFKAEKYSEATAEFAIRTYTITASAGTGGTIDPSGEVTVTHGTSQTFTITPESHYVVTDVIVDGASQGATTSYEFINVDAGHTISATFELDKHTITASAGTGGTIDPSGEVTVTHGTSQTFTFTPEFGYHVSAVIVDDAYVTLLPTSFTASYTFTNVVTEHNIDVQFSLNGVAYIPGGSDVTVFLDSGVSLSFPTVGEGKAVGVELPDFDPFTDVAVWEIDVVVADLGNGQVLVALRYDDTGIIDETLLRMYRGDFDYDLYVKCDFNLDGKIDGQDVSEISNRINNPRPYDSKYDLDGNGDINSDDLAIINSIKNAVWVDISSPLYPVDTENNIIYGITDHFSIFRGR